MKALLILLMTVFAGILPAQLPQFDPWLRTDNWSHTREARIILRLQDTYIYRGSRFTMDGIGVEVMKADNPLRLFDPFDAETLSTARDNVVWDQNTGRAIGLNFFSIHF
jgi:hypothetical protein